MRLTYSCHIPDDFTDRFCHWMEQQDIGMLFIGDGWNHGKKHFAGIGVHHRFQAEDIYAAAENVSASEDVVFAQLSYDLKNQLENLHSRNPSSIPVEDAQLYVPEWVFEWSQEELMVSYLRNSKTESEIIQLIDEILQTPINQGACKAGSINHKTRKESYVQDLRNLKDHIQQGDVYQGNYCQEFNWPTEDFSTAEAFITGFQENPNPFSVFSRNGSTSILSFSPERFMQFEGRKVTSQPMKGTAPRGIDPDDDYEHLSRLRNSEKDRRENVMIVDMVRNDLSHFAEKGSVTVPELYTIETYPRVHQMHSTVQAFIKPQVPILHVLLKAFPMGSMTGAPKIRAMQILENLEHTKRGIFSGTIGYLLPNGKADFNVVIRTLVYDSRSGLLSCHAGGGITALSNIDDEYEESLLKAKPIFELIERLSSGTQLPLKGEDSPKGIH